MNRRLNLYCYQILTQRQKNTDSICIRDGDHTLTFIQQLGTFGHTTNTAFLQVLAANQKRHILYGVQFEKWTFTSMLGCGSST